MQLSSYFWWVQRRKKYSNSLFFRRDDEIWFNMIFCSGKSPFWNWKSNIIVHIFFSAPRNLFRLSYCTSGVEEKTVYERESRKKLERQTTKSLYDAFCHIESIIDENGSLTLTHVVRTRLEEISCETNSIHQRPMHQLKIRIMSSIECFAYTVLYRSICMNDDDANPCEL